MRDTKEFTNSQANFVLRTAMKSGDFNLEDDPQYNQLKKAERDTQIAKNICIGFPIISTVLLFYKFSYKDRIPIGIVFGRSLFLFGMSGFVYLLNPAMKYYNDTLIEISERRKQDIKRYNDVAKEKSNSNI